MPTALLLHGLSSTPDSMWRWREWLEAEGWDVVGHAMLGHAGRGAAPRYGLHDHVADLAAEAPGPWDLVVGHSLGGSAAIAVAASDAGWTARLVLIDAPLWIAPSAKEALRDGELLELHATRDALLMGHPDWDERDIDAKVSGIEGVEPEAVRGTFDDTPVWDLRATAAALAVPTLLLAADPAVFTLVPPTDMDAVAANPLVDVHRVAGSGHSPHRDRPAAVHAIFTEWLG
jgi:3-oxoadipate enol-lactonase